MSTSDLTCLILAGGKGTRLRPITHSIPKPLVKVAGKAIIDYSVEHCLYHKVKNFIILSGYLSDKVTSHFDSTPLHESINLSIINSGDVDIIERIKCAIPSIKTKYLIILYGDTICDVNISDILKFHKSHGSIATMATWQMRSNFGVIDSDNSGMVINYKEKPKMDIWMNIGYIILSTNKINAMHSFDTFQKFLKGMVESKKLYAYKHNGFHYTVNNISELQDAEECLIKMHKKEKK